MAAHDTPVSDNKTRKTMTIQSVVCILCNAQRCIACEASAALALLIITTAACDH
jgi:hypothetical protein